MLVIVVLGVWFYFKPVPIDAPVVPVVSDTPTQQNTGNPPTSTISNPTETAPAGATVKNFNVSGINFSFAPSEIRVKKGDTVRITFKSTSGMHDFKIDEFQAATKVIRATDAEEVIEFVADRTGTFEYYCSVGEHRKNGMKGKLIVVE